VKVSLKTVFIKIKSVMKTVKTTLLIIAAVLVTNFVSATGNLRVNIAPAGMDNAIVEISNTEYSVYEIEIKDEYGEVFFAKEASEPAMEYRKAYDFSELEDGTYFMTVEIDNERIDNKIVIKDGLVKKYDQKKMIEPYFTFKDDKFKMSYLNFHGEEMNMYVYQGNDRIKEKDIDPAFTVHEGLDFSDADRGTYRIVFASGERTFAYEVEKK